MREIKFRGKRVDNGEWVVGDLVNHYENQRKFIACDQCAYTYSECGIDRLVTERFYEVIPKTVGQYTGLKDREGVEIYEGDVLRNIDNPLVDKLPFKVIWDEYYGAWFWWSESELDGAEADHLYQSIAKSCEVIGNIHENYELMVKKE